jgi:hypothetical protein
MAVYWHGTRQEASELLRAIAAHCSCAPAADAADPAPRAHRCPPHRMLVEDQRAVNGLLFVRQITDRLLLEEWDLTATGWADRARRAGPSEPSPAPVQARIGLA